jgi:hypothetical protein
MSRHEKFWALAALGAAAMVVAAPAAATSSASASLTDITITLIDLDLSDGIAPTLTWTYEGSYSYAQVQSDSESDYDSDSAAAHFAATSAMAGLPFGSASASTGAGVGAASGSASGPSYGGYGYFSANGQPLYGSFSVTPWTGVIVSGSFEGMAATTVGDNAEYAKAYGQLWIQLAVENGNDYHYTYRQAYASCEWVGDSCVADSDSYAGSIRLTYANLSSDTVDGWMGVDVSAYGGSMAPVPEPQTHLMLLAGLVGVGWVVGRRRRPG